MSAEPIPDCPYQGLEPFSENDRAYFFGRDVDTQRIGANLVTSPLTVFYGASGVGKTSVLLAGVLPFVHEQPDVTAIVFRRWQGTDFDRELKDEVAKAVAAKSDQALNVDQPLDRCLEEAARLTGGTIAVVFDQFEEYMLYHPPSSPEGRSFDAAFARAVNRSETDVNFLIGIREDALARLDRFRQYIPDLLSNRQQLIHLDQRGAEEAIRGPLEHYAGVVREQGKPELAMEIEDSLVAELIRQVRIGGVSFGGTGRIGDANVVRVETPFLQMVLMKLWEAERRAGSSRMREKTLHDLGDAKKMVIDHVDGVMRTLSAAERNAASAIFDRLVTPSRSKIAYALSDLEAFAGSYAAAVPSLVDHLANQHVRILRAVASADGQVRYEIFHDVLSEAVLAWRAKHLRDLEEADAKRRRVGCTVMAVIFLAVIGAIAWFLHRQNEERRELERQALDAQAKLLQVMSERASAMGSAGVARGDVALLRTALEGYRQLDDKDGERRILTQIATLLAGQQKYEDAIKAFDQAIALTTDPREAREIKARRWLAIGAQTALNDNQKEAARVYQVAAELFEDNGDAAQQAQALSSGAVALQNAGELDAAEKAWTAALNIQKKLNDVEGQSKSLAGLATIEKQRRLRQMPIVVTDTVEPVRAPEPCTLESMNGFWLEIGRRQARDEKFIWEFIVLRGKSGDVALEASRIDGSVKGAFVYVDNDDQFRGVLEWVSGEARKDVIFQTPAEQQNCGRIVTNQSFYFVRTKAPPAAAY